MGIIIRTEHKEIKILDINKEQSDELFKKIIAVIYPQETKTEALTPGKISSNYYIGDPVDKINEQMKQGCAGYHAKKEDYATELDPTKIKAYPRALEVTRVVGTAPIKGTMPQFYDPADGYSGFLVIKCEHCGEIKVFSSKEKIKEFKCFSCNEVTKLNSMKKLFSNCIKCGRQSKYLTNVTDETIEIPCIQCKAPVTVKYDERHSVYVTLK
jgi:ribosomal protein S27E